MFELPSPPILAKPFILKLVYKNIMISGTCKKMAKRGLLHEN